MSQYFIDGFVQAIEVFEQAIWPLLKSVSDNLNIFVPIFGALAWLFGTIIWLRRAARRLPKSGEELPHDASDLRQAQYVQRNRFILQAMCVAFYQSRLGKKLARPLVLLQDWGGHGGELPLLVGQGWIPEAPTPLREVELEWSVSSPPAKPLDVIFDNRLHAELGKNPIRNNLVYRLLSIAPISSEEPLRLTFSLDTYQGYVNTCEVVLWSSARFAVNYLIRMGLKFFVPEREKPLLTRAAPRILSADPIRKKITPLPLDNRCASVGVNTLTVLRRRASFAIFLMHRRSPYLREASGTYHVIPAGTFQPILYQDREHITEFDINFTLLREFAEECYDDKADVEGRLCGSIDEVRRNHRAFDMAIKMFTSGLIRTFLLGVTIDVVTLKPELLTLCIMDAEHLNRCFGPFKPQYEGLRIEEPFTRERLLELLQTSDTERMLAAAMGCLNLALKSFDYIEQELSKLPD